MDWSGIPTIGHVTAVSGSTLGVALAPDADSIGAARLGALVKVATPHSTVFGEIDRLHSRSDGMRLLDIELLGERMGDADPRSQRGVSIYPVLGNAVVPATREEIGLVYSKPSAATVRIGTVYQDPSVAAYVMTDALLGKHFAVLGTTGYREELCRRPSPAGDPRPAAQGARALDRCS